jgi:hypothetical protein
MLKTRGLEWHVMLDESRRAEEQVIKIQRKLGRRAGAFELGWQHNSSEII